jgi:hypothetical protein
MIVSLLLSLYEALLRGVTDGQDILTLSLGGTCGRIDRIIKWCNGEQDRCLWEWLSLSQPETTYVQSLKVLQVGWIIDNVLSLVTEMASLAFQLVTSTLLLPKLQMENSQVSSIVHLRSN